MPFVLTYGAPFEGLSALARGVILALYFRL